MTSSIPVIQKKLSTQMCAILLIFCADTVLMESIEPFVDLKTESIDWEQIRRIPFGSGHRAATSIAYSIWTDKILEGGNPFELALSMEKPLQRACLQALAVRWGLKS
jgi:hypothetical protein